MSNAASERTDEMLPEVREAIRIADKHLPLGTVEQRKNLATDIVNAINEGQRELGAEIMRRCALAKTGGAS